MATHALFVNSRTDVSIKADIVLHTSYARDPVTGAELEMLDNALSLPLEAGAFRLLALVNPDAEGDGGE